MIDQLDGLMRVTRYPRIRDRLATPLAGRLINELRDIAIVGGGEECHVAPADGVAGICDQRRHTRSIDVSLGREGVGRDDGRSCAVIRSLQDCVTILSSCADCLTLWRY
jgi:hypothetical protein